MAKTRPGDKLNFKSEWLNKVDDLIKKPGGVNQPVFSGNNTNNIIFIKNTHSAYVEANGILGIGSSLIEPTDEEETMLFRFKKPTFEGVVPEPGVHDVRLCVLLQGLDTDEIGPAIITGSVAVQIDILDTNHLYATIASESTNDPTEVLESSPAGSVAILWANEGEEIDGTGVAWAIISLGASSVPQLWEATSSASDNIIEGKRVNSSGSLSGDEQEFWAMD